jgi:hypothetical protein
VRLCRLLEARRSTPVEKLGPRLMLGLGKSGTAMAPLIRASYR